jgi:hypothetical protein
VIHRLGNDCSVHLSYESLIINKTITTLTVIDKLSRKDQTCAKSRQTIATFSRPPLSSAFAQRLGVALSFVLTQIELPSKAHYGQYVSQSDARFKDYH